jgi:hypothetical protein
MTAAAVAVEVAAAAAAAAAAAVVLAVAAVASSCSGSGIGRAAIRMMRPVPHNKGNILQLFVSVVVGRSANKTIYHCTAVHVMMQMCATGSTLQVHALRSLSNVAAIRYLWFCISSEHASPLLALRTRYAHTLMFFMQLSTHIRTTAICVLLMTTIQLCITYTMTAHVLVLVLGVFAALHVWYTLSLVSTYDVCICTLT